jgi:hypothetical protein
MPPPPTYSTFKSHLYSFKMQCSDCKQLIRGSKAIRIGTQLWHPDHFTCHSCGLRLKDKTVFQVSGYNYCLMDYKCKFAPRCEECSEFVLGVKKTRLKKSFQSSPASHIYYIVYFLVGLGARWGQTFQCRWVMGSLCPCMSVGLGGLFKGYVGLGGDSFSSPYLRAIS